MANSSGVFVGDIHPDDSKLFICERHTLADVLNGMTQAYACGMPSHPWILHSAVQACYAIIYAVANLSRTGCTSVVD